MKYSKAFTLLEIILVLAILGVLFGLVLYYLEPEQVFEASDATQAETNKSDIETAYVNYRLRNQGNVPLGELIPGIYYSICKEGISDCTSDNYEVSLKELKNERFLKEIPIHPIYSSERHTGYLVSELNNNVNVIDQNEVEYTAESTPPGECFEYMELNYCVLESNGELWLDRNLGAIQVAISITDTLGYGDLFQWGRSYDGHQQTSPLSPTQEGPALNLVPGETFLINSSNWYGGENPDNLWQGSIAVNNPCPSTWRVATVEEWESEINSWSTQDMNGAYASLLKLPLNGKRAKTGALQNSGSIGYYWSSETSESYFANSLFISNSDASFDEEERAVGMAVRCIKAGSEQNVIINDTANYSLIKNDLGQCTGNFEIEGEYEEDEELSANETVTISAFVAVPGVYSVITNSDNGYSFSASGEFSTTGNQTIILENDGGTPNSPGIDIFTVDSGNSICEFNIEIEADPTPTAEPSP